MRERSLHLVNQVMPHVPIRQWVLSVPFEIRYLIAYKPEIVTQVLTIYVRVISSWIKKQARARGIRKPYTGSVTVIQRAGSALNLNTHLHGLFLDGYFAREPGTGEIKFHKAKFPTDEDMGKIVLKIKRKVIQSLKEKGYLNDFVEDDSMASVFESCIAASVRYRSALGERAEKKIRMLGRDPAKTFEVQLKGKNCATSEGFSLHANTRLSAKNRMGLEKLTAYISRPPLSSERLSRRADGSILLQLKRPFADGTTFIAFEPLEFIEKLAALVPPPWANLARFHGCFGPNSKVRKEIVPKLEAGEEYPCIRRKWSEILKHSFKIDIFKCGYCGGKTHVTAAILDPKKVKDILKSMGLPTEPPEIRPARGSPQTQFDWSA